MLINTTAISERPQLSRIGSFDLVVLVDEGRESVRRPSLEELAKDSHTKILIEALTTVGVLVLA